MEDYYAVTHWIYIIAALLLGSSLLFATYAGRCGSIRAIFVKVLPFIPVVILIYTLFMVSQLF